MADTKWDIEADVAVVGTGAAGSSAALFSHEKGARVVMLEKARRYGGTTEKSGGVFHTPNNSIMRAMGLRDEREDAIRYYARLAYPTLYNPGDPRFGLNEHQYSLIAAYYDNAAPAIDGLTAMKALQAAPWLEFDGQRMFPDYFAHLPENKAPRGRGLIPKDPETGQGVQSGFELIRQLKAAVEKRGIPVMLNHRASRLLLDGHGGVAGVEGIAEGKKTISIRTRKAVIFGSGGFTQNPEMRLDYLRGPVYGGCAVPTNEGDFVHIAAAVGAKLANMANAWWAQTVLEEVLQNPSPPTDIFVVPGDSMIQVNKHGRRVMSEKFVYNERTQVHFGWDPVVGEYKNLFLFMIYDQRTADIWSSIPGFGYPIPPKGSPAPHVISGRTVEELAGAIDERLTRLAGRTGGFHLDKSFVANLRDSLSRFNQYAESGVDLEFHRGETPVELAFHGPAAPGNDKPNRTMYPVSPTGPYYAIILAGGTLDTKGGPKINAKAQVLDRDDRPIPGLYGAGNCIGSPAAQGYWAGGGTIGPALTFGYIAALNAVLEPIKEEG
ncbi:MAG: FAD-dependent oxidoreductase [Candidatus Aminicenantes bacterium]|nr:FAD-dependent oxidoreductase [Candidatus Aminicenantes bacterium]NLH77868.1 FAD-dependent oxidoreductase [Acidobacteriota bacterium]